MTPEEAKRILLLYRPNMAEENEFAEALQEARRNPDLGHWLAEHLATQEALRRKFRELAPPPELHECILTGRKVVRPVWWRRPPAWIAAAASIALLIGLGAWFTGERKPDHFADYRARMVRTVLREYRMDILTNDAEKVRQYMQSRGAPADYSIPKGLQQVAVKGGGLLGWRGTRVTMVCFERPDKELMYFFVLDRNAVKDPPPENFEVTKVNKLTTASWSSGNRIYVLAGQEDLQSIRKYL